MEEPQHARASKPTVPSNLLRENRRLQRLAWARGSASSQALFGGEGAGRPAWSVNVAVVDRARMLRGWTQRELARRAHVDPGTLSDLLAHRRRPTFGTVQAICASLNLTLADVIAFPSDGT